MKPKVRKCTCKAYPFPHRASGGLCRYPDPPLETFNGKAGQHAPVGMRPRSAIRRRLMRKYALHRILDRELIRRWLPKLYVAYCRRHGYPYPERWFDGYVPAIRVTADGPRAANCPTPQPLPPGYRYNTWRDGMHAERRIGSLRSVEKRRRLKMSVLPSKTGVGRVSGAATGG